MSSSIGNHTFCFLRRNDQRGDAPELPYEQKSVLRRPGTDGVSVRHEGKAGQPFRSRSFRDFEAIEDALNAIDNYKSVEESTDTYILNWNGVNYFTGYGVKYAVLAVGDFNIVRVRNVVGVARITNNPAYILQATWDLLPVEA